MYYSSNINVDVDILSTSSKPVRKYSHRGKTFIEGKKGSEFSIRIKNPNTCRVEVVISVDGLSVINGKKASTGSTGYVLDGYNSIVIDGWRISDDFVRKFFFTEKENSYSSRKDGDSDNCGVISILAYAEYREPVSISYPLGDYKSVLLPSENFILCSTKCSNTTDNFDLGTGMGEKVESKVTGVNFRRGEFLGDNTFYYASRKSLIDMGIDVEKKVKVNKLPQAFTDYCEEIPNDNDWKKYWKTWEEFQKFIEKQKLNLK